MSFGAPHFLWLLAAIGAVLVWEVTHRRRAARSSRPKILRAEADSGSVQLLDAGHEASRSARPRYWLAAGLGLAVLALARPQWGRLEEPVFDQSREILLSVDLSRSMLTPDVKPSRLARTKLLIQSLLEKLAGERVGLVVFAGTAFLQAPLSADYEILREFLPALEPGFLPEGGTHYGSMLDTAIQAFGATGSADRFLIVLSDGEATDADWRGRLDDLRKKGVRVIGLGVGTAGGGMIPEKDGTFVKDDRGAVVLSKLESATLQELSRATGGVYRDASTWIDLAGVLKETVEAGRKGDFVEKNTVRLAERYQWPLAFGLWCLLVSFYREFPVRPKPRQIALRGGSRPEAAGATPWPVRAASVFLAAVGCGVALTPSLEAAAKLAPKPAAPAAASPAAPPSEPSALSKIVGRLSAAESRNAHDWAELGRETATWGSRLKSEQHAVPEGPVRDALLAVNLGEKLDAKAADWPQLRRELEALLDQPEDKDQKQEDKKQQGSQQDKSQQKKDQDERSEDQQQQSSDPNQSKSSDDKSGKKPEEQNASSKPDEAKPPGDSAFGDMEKKEPPPPPPQENTQKVGGAPEKKDEDKREQMDPALALPLQKLDQLRSQDSPAVLFQLMEGDKKPSARKPGKDW
ncbi:MAG: VWA domain-containing protein [Verrucomicrobia bacterium]|nr:VWA domain-containing protein [Verrucomicrobiota bacterium]